MQRIWSHLLKKSLMENFIFCAVIVLLTRGKSEKLEYSPSTNMDYKIEIYDLIFPYGTKLWTWNVIIFGNY